MDSKEIDNKVFAGVEKAVDRLVENDVYWSRPVSGEEIRKARAGDLVMYLSQHLPVPRDWFPRNLAGIKALCLAGAGGKQGPLLAAAGADVTVLDLSEGMLEKDRLVAQREGLALDILHGNMCDLSRFADATFDLIVNPPSLMYVPDVRPVFTECYRVLKKGGIFITAAPYPISYICDYIPDGNYYRVNNTIPYKSFEHPDQGDWVEFGHSLGSLIGGQTACGFAITGFYEDTDDSDPLSAYSATGFVTRAVK